MIENLKNKKGFTLVEVIAVVVIIGLLAGVSIPLISKYINDGKEKYNINVEKEFLAVVKDYFSDNPDKMPNNNGESAVVWLPELSAKNYLTDELNDADGGSCYNSVGYVNYQDGQAKYYVCLKCDKYEGSTYGKYDECVESGEYNECSYAPDFDANVFEVKYLDGSEWKDAGDGDVVTNLSVSIIFKLNQESYLEYNNKKYFSKTPVESEEYKEYGDGHYIELILDNANIKSDYEFIFKSVCLNSKNIDLGRNIIVDKVAPSIKIEGEKEVIIKYNDSNNLEDISNNIVINDSGSGIKYVKYKYSGIDADYTTILSPNGKIEVKRQGVTSGSYILEVEAVDVVGNVATFSKKIKVLNQVKLVSDGEQVGELINKQKDIDIDLDQVLIDKKGYYIEKWNDKDGNSYTDSYGLNKSTILTVKWNEFDDSVANVTVVYDCDADGKKDSDEISDTFIYGVSKKFNSNACSKKGYNLYRWHRDKIGSSEANDYKPSWKVNNNFKNAFDGKTVYLTPKWKAKTVTVVYDCDKDGVKDSGEKSDTFTYGETNYLSGSACSKNGYNLYKWHRDKIGDSDSNNYEITWKVSNDFKIAFDGKTIYLTPKWEAKSVKVVYDCDKDGKKDSSEKSDTFTYGETKKLNGSACSKTGYNLSEWHRKKIGDSEANDYKLTWTVSDDFKKVFDGKTIYLTPKWEAKTVKVTFYCSSSDKKSQTFTYGVDNQKFTKECTKTGLVQKGWAIKADGDKKYNVSASVSNKFINSYSPSVTLYPVYHYECTDCVSTCSNDKVRPTCELLSSCYSVSGGVRAKFRCKDATSKITIYSVFAETGWQESRFKNKALIEKNMDAKGSGSAGTWITKDTEWSWATTPGKPPTSNNQYTFYFGAIDSCGNAIVFDNVTTACKY